MLRIKILKKGGVSYGTFEIPLRKSRRVKPKEFCLLKPLLSTSKMVRCVKPNWIQKMCFWKTKLNIMMQKSSLSPMLKKEVLSKFLYVWNLLSSIIFALGNSNLKSQNYKVNFGALIPGNYIYNISLKGFLKLSKEETELVSECFLSADCARLKYGIKNIPAFIEEEFMTAKSNLYLLSILSFHR